MQLKHGNIFIQNMLNYIQIDDILTQLYNVIKAKINSLEQQKQVTFLYCLNVQHLNNTMSMPLGLFYFAYMCTFYLFCVDFHTIYLLVCVHVCFRIVPCVRPCTRTMGGRNSSVAHQPYRYRHDTWNKLHSLL